MDRSEIRDGVEYAIKLWVDLQERRNSPVYFTDQARDVIETLIENIAADPSPFWGEVNADSAQRYALSLIPNALNDVINNRGYSYRQRQRESGSLRLSSWEIYRSLSTALQNWCFIPEEI